MRFAEIDTLFIHIPKTGGTTISQAISQRLYADEFRKGALIIDMYKDKTRRVVDRNVRKAHVYAIDYRRSLGRQLYEKHYTFAFVRNPFEQIRSLFAQLTYMNIKQNPGFIPYKTMTFEEFVMGEGPHSMLGNDTLIDQVKYVTDPKTGDIIVNDVFPFDHYAKALRILNVKRGIFVNPKIKMRPTKNKADLYSPEMASKVIDNYGHVYEFNKKIKKEFEEYVLPKY